MACFGCFSDPEPVGSIQERIEYVISTFTLDSIDEINNKIYNIHLDGYQSQFGESPIFNVNDIGFILPESDLYASIPTPIILSSGTVYDPYESKCVDQEGQYQYLKFTNPDITKLFRPSGNQVIWEDVMLEELPIPPPKQKYAFTYIVVLSQDGYHIRYGQIFNFTEISVKHSILAGKDLIIVSGELAIRNTGEFCEYVININSSKMKRNRQFVELIKEKNKIFYIQHQFRAEQLYFIMMFHLAFRIMKSLCKKQTRSHLRLPRDTLIRYTDDSLYVSESPANEYLVPYYEKEIKECPSDSYISEYNSFGQRPEIKNETPYGVCMHKKTADGYTQFETVKIEKEHKSVLKCTGKKGKLGKKRKSSRKIKKRM